MIRVFRMLAPLAVAAVFAAAASGQEAPPPPDLMAQQNPEGPDPQGPGGPGPRGPGGPGFRRMELLGVGGMHGGKVVTGAPFTAVAVTTMSHSLADGTKISNTIKVTLYRDSQGRFRKEGSMPPVGNMAADQPRSFIAISDPVASKGYLLNPDKKIAHVTSVPNRGRKGGKGGSPAAADSAAPNAEGEKEWGNNPNVTKTPLGTQTISGVSAEGTRYTRVIPAGEIGNDKPITITREVWYSIRFTDGRADQAQRSSFRRQHLFVDEYPAHGARREPVRCSFRLHLEAGCGPARARQAWTDASATPAGRPASGTEHVTSFSPEDGAPSFPLTASGGQKEGAVVFGERIIGKG